MSIQKANETLGAEQGAMRRGEGGAAIVVQVSCGADTITIDGVEGDVILISLDVPSPDGTANQVLIDFLARKLDIDPGKIVVVAGHSGHQKLVSIIGLRPDEVISRLPL